MTLARAGGRISWRIILPAIYVKLRMRIAVYWRSRLPNALLSILFLIFCGANKRVLLSPWLRALYRFSSSKMLLPFDETLFALAWVFASYVLAGTESWVALGHCRLRRIICTFCASRFFVLFPPLPAFVLLDRLVIEQFEWALVQYMLFVKLLLRGWSYFVEGNWLLFYWIIFVVSISNWLQDVQPIRVLIAVQLVEVPELLQTIDLADGSGIKQFLFGFVHFQNALLQLDVAHRNWLLFCTMIIKSLVSSWKYCWLRIRKFTFNEHTFLAVALFFLGLSEWKVRRTLLTNTAVAAILEILFFLFFFKVPMFRHLWVVRIVTLSVSVHISEFRLLAEVNSV